MGTERLPDLSFKRYLGIIVYDIEDPHEIVKHIVEAIEKSLEKLQGEELSLLAVMLYDGDWELRVWVNPVTREATILHNISEANYKPGDIYKITIEEFTVTKTAMELHHEIAEARGLKPVTVPLDLLPSLLTKTLKIKLTEPTVAKKASRSKAEETGTPVEAKAVSLALCLEKLWATCSSNKCEGLRDPLEQLDELGIAILGSGTEYTCILRDAEGCPYLAVTFKEGKTTVRCLSSKNEVAELVNRLRARGYEAAIA